MATDAADTGSTAVVLGRVAIVLVVTTVVGVIAALLFVGYPTSGVELAGLLLVLVTIIGGLKLGGSLASWLLPGYDVAEIGVEGPITRDGGGRRLPPSPRTVTADDIVAEIEKADADDNVDGLLVRLNTPGGEVVPSDDIRMAVADFEGPTVAYVTDMCGSGGYWIASGCDEIIARDASLVGSIGVLGSRITATDLAERLGISYERFAAGKYKDTGIPLREMDEDDRAYLQGLIDDLYATFVDRVVSGRDLDPETVTDTEARVYLGEDALELGLVDAIGDREAAIDQLTDRLDRPAVSPREFEPEHGLAARLRTGAQSVAFAFGAGIASTLGGDPDSEIDIRI